MVKVKDKDMIKDKVKDKENNIVKDKRLYFNNNPEFETLFNRWLKYKKDIKDTYKSEDSIQTKAKQLFNWSNGDIKIATEIIEISIGNGYHGFFKPKTQNTPNSFSNSGNIEELTKEQIYVIGNYLVSKGYDADEVRETDWDNPQPAVISLAKDATNLLNLCDNDKKLAVEKLFKAKESFTDTKFYTLKSAYKRIFEDNL